MNPQSDVGGVKSNSTVATPISVTPITYTMPAKSTPINIKYNNSRAFAQNHLNMSPQRIDGRRITLDVQKITIGMNRISLKTTTGDYYIDTLYKYYVDWARMTAGHNLLPIRVKFGLGTGIHEGRPFAIFVKKYPAGFDNEFKNAEELYDALKATTDEENIAEFAPEKALRNLNTMRKLHEIKGINERYFAGDLRNKVSAGSYMEYVNCIVDLYGKLKAEESEYLNY